MKVVSKTGMGAALVFVALLLSCAVFTGTPALGQSGFPPDGQYGVPPDGQYAPPPEDQYDSPPPSTEPIPEDQYGTSPENQTEGENGTGGNEGTTSVGGEDGAGENDEGAREANTPDRSSSDDTGTLSGLLDGFLADSVTLLAVLSLITTIIFLAERFMGRPGS